MMMNKMDILKFQRGDKVIAKFNLEYLNPDDIVVKLIKGNEYIVESSFCSNYSDGIIVKGETGPPMAYYYHKIFPFYTIQELRDKKIRDILE